MKLTFWGAAGEVTGSCSLLESQGKKFLVDCGMFQGGHEHEQKNEQPLGFDPAELTAVFVTHAHLDHVGRLPLLVKSGFTGPIYATAPTADLAALIMADAAGIMHYDHQKFGRPITYKQSDVDQAAELFKRVEYHENIIIPGIPAADFSACLYDEGHIFGSAFVEIKAGGKHLVFSGDVGNEDVPILRDTEPLPAGLDVLVCESTYGDRKHEPSSERLRILREAITAGLQRGGSILVASFSLERAQELLYELNEMIEHSRDFPHVPIFVDSPLAIDALRVYRNYPRYYDAAAKECVMAGDDIFKFPSLNLTYTREESKRINQVRGQKIIIAGAGMLTGGRILHHALRYLSDEQSTLLLTGYQSVGTLGRRLLEGESPVEIMGERVKVRCQVKMIGALSAHGDQDKLANWITGGKTAPRQVILNHGDPAACAALIKRLGANGVAAEAAVFGKTCLFE